MLRRLLSAGTAAALVPLAGGAFALATAPAAAAQPLGTQCAAVTSGSAAWGIKESFRSYLKSPIAMGGWDLQGVGFHGAEDGADGAFDFAAKPAPASRISGADADIPLEGSMVLHGHFDLLRIELSNMSIKVRGNQAQFIADFSSNTVNKPAPGAQITGHETGTQLPIASFALDAPIDAAGAASGGFALSGTGTITADGNRAFGGNYGEGNNTTDRLEVRGTAVPSPCFGGELGALAAAAPATGVGELAAGGDGTGEQGGASPNLDVSAPPAARPVAQPAAVAAPRANRTAGSAPSAAPASGAVCSDADAKGVADARMSWGVKDSFRTYIRSGTAKGGWTTAGGAVYNSNAFVFSGSDGAVDVARDQGSLRYGGSVEFTGHGGVLDLTLANPEIQFAGGTGALIADVTSNDTEGESRSLGRITVADLAVTQSSSADMVDGSASATLTAAGASAMSDFYPAGTEMAPVTFKASLSGAASCADAAGTSASSSAPGNDSGGAKAAALAKGGPGLGAMPEDETAAGDKDGPNGDRSATSLLGESVDDEDDRSIPMALASNAGVPIAAAMLLIAAGTLGYVMARNRRAVRTAGAAGPAAGTTEGEADAPGADAATNDHTTGHQL